MEYLPKDMLCFIAMKLDDILSFSLTNKIICDKICNNIYFIRNKLRKDFGFVYHGNNVRLGNIYYDFLRKNNLSSQGIINSYMYRAAKAGYKDLVKYYIFKGANNFYLGMDGAAEGGHMNIIKYLESKNQMDYRYVNMNMLCSASEGGHMNIIKYSESKGADNWNEGMRYAARGGHMNIIKYFESKGAKEWNGGMRYASEGGHINLVKYFESKGAKDWNEGMRSAAIRGHINLVKYFVSKGGNDWAGGISCANLIDNKDIVKYLLKFVK